MPNCEGSLLAEEEQQVCHNERGLESPILGVGEPKMAAKSQTP